MRISDWSSDVCSSDLVLIEVIEQPETSASGAIECCDVCCGLFAFQLRVFPFMIVVVTFVRVIFARTVRARSTAEGSVTRESCGCATQHRHFLMRKSPARRVCVLIP